MFRKTTSFCTTILNPSVHFFFFATVRFHLRRHIQQNIACYYSIQAFIVFISEIVRFSPGSSFAYVTVVYSATIYLTRKKQINFLTGKKVLELPEPVLEAQGQRADAGAHGVTTTNPVPQREEALLQRHQKQKQRWHRKQRRKKKHTHTQKPQKNIQRTVA